jgi:hypothetical protein
MDDDVEESNTSSSSSTRVPLSATIQKVEISVASRSLPGVSNSLLRWLIESFRPVIVH